MTMVMANGVTHHVQRLPATGHTGAGPAPIVVLMHGLLIDSLYSYYFTFGPAFTAAGLDVIMYDLRGHGRSARPSTGYRLADFSDDLDGLLDGLRVRTPVHLVGNSFGGTIAFGYAERRPERVASVILVDSTPATTGWAMRMVNVADPARVLFDSASATTGGVTRMVNVADLARVKDQLSRPEVIAGINDSHGAPTARLTKRAARLLWSSSIVEDLLASEVIPAGRLAEMAVPTMAIYGGDSDLAGETSWLEAALPSCTTAVVAGQGHWVLLNRPALAGELILKWLQEHC